MLKTTFKIIFENIFLHLHQNNFQNVRTPPPDKENVPSKPSAAQVIFFSWVKFLV